MIIKKAKIENFKRFDDLEVEFSSFDCIVGANNSGKTTLLQSLALFDFCLHHCLTRRNGEIELKRRTIAPEEFYVLPIVDPVHLWTDRRTQAGGKHKIIKIGVTFEGDKGVTANIDLNYNRFAISIESNDQSTTWLEQLLKSRISILPVFSMFLPQEERRTPAVISDELARGRVNSVIRNLLLDLKLQDRQHDLIQVLQRTFPDLTNIDILFDEVSDRYISVTYQERGRPKQFDLFAAGSGFQQFVYLFGFIILQQPTVVLLDEPDVHLHGTLQHTLLEELERLVENGKQVLFATHSSDLIRRVNPEHILTIEATNVTRLRVAFDTYDTLDKLGSIDQTQLPIVQNYQRVLGLEGESDKQLLWILCSKVLGQAIWQQVERRLAICYLRGNPWKQKGNVQKLREQLQSMLSIRGRALEMYVIGDRDYHPDLQGLLTTLPSNHLVWHIWQRAEIENYLLNLDGLQRVLGDFAEESPDLFELLKGEYEKISNEQEVYDRAFDRLTKAYDEISKADRYGWDNPTVNQKAREYLSIHWEEDKLELLDAKDYVLPRIKQWAQSQRIGQFSDKALADALLVDEIPQEIHQVAHELANFAGVAT